MKASISNKVRIIDVLTCQMFFFINDDVFGAVVVVVVELGIDKWLKKKKKCI